MLKRELSLKLLVIYYLLNTFLMILTLFDEQIHLKIVLKDFILGLPYINNMYYKIILTIIVLIELIGLLMYKKWAYLCLVFYNLYFIIINLYILSEIPSNQYLMNITMSVLVIMYAIYKKSDFDEEYVVLDLE